MPQGERRLPGFEGCEVLELIRKGPITDLYRAIQRPLGRKVLLKALNPSILPSSPFASTLEREARLLAELDHPNIIRVIDFVRKGERMWLLLEDVDGDNLDVRLKPGPMTAAEAAAVGLEVARALAHAHDRNVIHRDVQPRNVLLTPRGKVKLMGFAVAVDDPAASIPELLDGSGSSSSLAYMSPEQILGERPDPRSDLFSLGTLLYAAVAGRHPFEVLGDDRKTTLAIRRDPPDPLPRSLGSPPLERVILRCLEKMPGDRPSHARDVERALRDVLRRLGHEWATEVLRVGEAPPSLRDLPSAERPDRRQPASLRLPLVGLALAGSVIVASTVVGHTLSGPRAVAPSPRPRPTPAPGQLGGLRVVADPWAHVVVDGDRRETTPFHAPIELPAGKHHVRLEHPKAPAERRTITVRAGETVRLEVRMNVPARPEPPPRPVPTTSASGASP